MPISIDTPSQSVEAHISKPKEVRKLQKEGSIFAQYASAKSHIAKISSRILNSFRNLSKERSHNVQLGPEAEQMQELSEQFEGLEAKTDIQLKSSEPNDASSKNDQSIAKKEVANDITITKGKTLEGDTNTPQVNKETDKKTYTVETKPLTPDDYAPFPPESIEQIFGNPDRLTYTTLTYESGKQEGDKLDPNKRMCYRIPKEYQGRIIRDIILKHRKDPSRFTGNHHDWDPDGAYSRVSVKDSKTGEWKNWIDPAGYNSDKFAEPRSASDPENEVLHDWIKTVGEVCPSLISVENVGKTELAVSNIHGVEVVFFPEAGKVSYQEQIFSPGTIFVDVDKGIIEPKYGGGKYYGKKYPGAVELGNHYTKDGKLPLDDDPTKPAYLDEQGWIHIKLQPRKHFVNLELAVGDTHPDTEGTRGWAKIYAGLKTQQEKDIQYFMNNVNVPPAGVLAGGPQEADRIVKDGEEIIINSRADVTYLMGYRVSYKEE